MPGGRVPSLAEHLGKLGALAAGDRRAMAARHQRRVRPELTDAEVDRAVQEVFASYVRYWVESFRLPGTSAADLDAGFRCDGYEHIEAGLADGNGVILALPHLGGWEWAGFWLTEVKQVRVTVVVEAVEPPELADWFLGLRRELGHDGDPARARRPPPRWPAPSRPTRSCACCATGTSPANGIEVEFFGERTTLPGGPATLAAAHRCPAAPGRRLLRRTTPTGASSARRSTSTRQGRLRDDVARITQDLADELERG